jgi:hypothetical protein
VFATRCTCLLSGTVAAEILPGEVWRKDIVVLQTIQKKSLRFSFSIKAFYPPLEIFQKIHFFGQFFSTLGRASRRYDA